jgi:hypothetical protein
MLASAGLRIAAVDLRTLSKDTNAARWFAKPRASKYVGSTFDEHDPADLFQKEVIPRDYDALLFVEKVTAAESFSPMTLWQRLPAPANTDFECSGPGTPPVDWQVPAKLARYDFEIITTDEHPHTGKQCARISRLPGRHYGEVVGSLSQRVDAAAYRNKRIILNAAVRAEPAGRESHAYLRLQITGKTSDPFGQSTIFDSLEKYPVTSSDWQTFQIATPVPPDADAISYGLFLVGDGNAWLDSVSLETTGK